MFSVYRHQQPKYTMAVRSLDSEWVSPLSIWTLVIVVAFVAVSLAFKRFKFVRRVNKVPGSFGGLTFLGNAVHMISVPPDERFHQTVAYMVFMRSAGPILRVWAGPFPVFFAFTAHAFEVVLSSSKLIDKSREYDFLHPWLGAGLLTSSGSKWHSRRKLLTPTFHFKILENFIKVFNEHCIVLAKQLESAVKTEKCFDIYPFITYCTLDIICDAAMGYNIRAQTESESDYVKAVYAMSRIVQARYTLPWLQPDILFHLSSYGSEQRKSLKILHDFTDKVIRERKLEHRRRVQAGSSTGKKLDDDSISSKPRLAFLDLLIEASQDGAVLSDTDIREEVDTFMFEGHDTTTAAINWTLLCIASHPHIQAKVNEELDRVFDGRDGPVTTADLVELKYLECCIKEALRLYPPVPFVARKLSEDTIIHGYELPANTSIVLSTFNLHRDPEHFPDPEVYKPERFFPENSHGRHPFAYVPFSAGARNCIGQKFALMEEKVILAWILRRFHVESLTKRDEMVLLGELILRPRDGIRLCLTPKKK